MRLMQRSWAALLVCATVWLVSCVDDNPVVPDQTYNAAEELAKETFNNDAWLDRTVKPGDSFWHFAIGGWLNTRDVEDFGTIDNLAKTIQEKLSQNVNGYDSPVAGKLFKLLTQAAPQKSEEIKVINDFLSTLKLDGDVSEADLIRNFGKLYDIGCPALVLNYIQPMDGQLKCFLISGIPVSTYFNETVPSLDTANEGKERASPEARPHRRGATPPATAVLHKLCCRLEYISHRRGIDAAAENRCAFCQLQPRERHLASLRRLVRPLWCQARRQALPGSRQPREDLVKTAII